jgi:cytochrome P450
MFFKDASAILSADKENHSRLRRILAPALSEKSIKGHDETIVKYVNLLVKQLKKRCSQDAIDLNKYFEWVRTFLFLANTLGMRADGVPDNYGPHWRFIVWPTRRGSPARRWRPVAADIDSRYPISSLVRENSLNYGNDWEF